MHANACWDSSQDNPWRPSVVTVGLRELIKKCLMYLLSLICWTKRWQMRKQNGNAIDSSIREKDHVSVDVAQTSGSSLRYLHMRHCLRTIKSHSTVEESRPPTRT